MKRVLLIADIEGWAWWWMCQGVQKYAPAGYRVDVLTNNDFWYYTTGHNSWDGIDAVLQCSWVEASMGIPVRNVTLLASHGAEFEYPPKDTTDIPSCIATKLRNRQAAESRLDLFDMVLCVSRGLAEVCREFTQKIKYCHPGVDTDIFRPVERKPNPRPRIGWCGQQLGLTKGYEELLVPLRHLLYDEFGWDINDSRPTAARYKTQAEMAEWYNSLDLFISTSCSEGSQMPVLEAAACGVPVLATNVGTAAEVVNDMDTGYVLPRWRTEMEASETLPLWIERLRGLTRDRIWSMGQAARQRVEAKFGWDRLAGRWLRAICGE